MMDISRLSILVRLLFFTLACLSFQTQAATLKIATIAPDGTSWMDAMRNAAKEIEKQTDGRVKMRFYPGGVMGNDKSMLRKIRVGQLQGGAITGGGLTSFYADAYIYNLPFLFRSFDEVDYVRQYLDPVLIEGIRQQGFISYGLSEGGFAYLMSKNRVTTLPELQQQKVWVPEGDNISLAAFKALDISPIPLPLTDVMTGLQTELINTVATPPIGAIALQWHSRLHYLVDIPLTYLYGTLIIDERAIKKLSDHDQNILSNILKETSLTINDRNRKDNKAAIEALNNQGMQFIHPDKAEIEPWQNKVSLSVDDMVKEGMFSSKIYNLTKKHLSNYRTNHSN